MKMILMLLLGLLALPAVATGEPMSLEKVARAYAVGQPGLQSYRATVVTEKISQMLEKMTANLPADVPRPPQPTVVKYWSRLTESSLVRPEGTNVFPFMAEMVGRFSQEFSIELRSFLLPAARTGDRALLLEKSTIKRSRNQLGESLIESLTIDFNEPVNLDGSFYKRGLEIPQDQVSRLVIDLDPELEIVKRFEVSTSGGDVRTVEVRHFEAKAGQFPNEILVSTPDGSIDDHFQIRFDLIDGFWVPVRMVHTLRKGEVKENLYVKFRDYQINVELPQEVREQLR